VSVLAGVVAAATMAVGATAGASSPAASSSTTPTLAAPCPPVAVGYATCLARVLGEGGDLSSGGSRQAGPEAGGATPAGLSPAAISTAYGFSGTSGGSGETVALVDSYDDPTIAANLATFSTQFGLPACTTTSGCFTKVNQTGGSTYPKATSGWGLEISLDVEWAHALAPNAHILLVEAASDSDTSLFSAVSYAAQHAQYVSMSWGGTEFSGEAAFDASFSADPSDSFFAAAGDSASSVLYPSTSPDVVSVGGTTLNVTPATDAWQSETAWSTAGGGCSRFEAPTAAQKGFATYDQAGATCKAKRATPDVSLDANPNTGVSVYDTKKLPTGLSGWIQVGGTSASTVMLAAHSATTGAHVNATYLYGANVPFYNVTSGSNGHPCEVGYNLCTGLGSWNVGHGAVNAPPVGSLSFSSAAQTLVAGKPSGAVTVHLGSAAPSGGAAVKLTTSSANGGFSASATGTYTHTLTVDVASGGSNAAAYYEDTTAGDPVLSASATGWTAASQTEIVGPGPVAKITVSPATATLAEGATQLFTAAGTDAYGNTVTAGFAPTWTTTTGGSLSAKSGTSTTLTAPGATVTKGTVTATEGTVSGAATVTVVAAKTVKVAVAAGPETKRPGPGGYSVPLTVTATLGATGISGAGVTLDVYSGSCAGPLVASGTGKTGSAGTVTFTFTTTGTGSYCAKATVTATGYSAATATTAFVVTAVKASSKAPAAEPRRVSVGA
jgi:hypothetical protein